MNLYEVLDMFTIIDKVGLKRVASLSPPSTLFLLRIQIS